MKVRLMGGVVAQEGLRAWLPHALEEPAPGAAVALGPEGSGPERVSRALGELARLVAAGGVVAAGASVDLGDGFRSARLEGARGDQRDAVLAALQVLGVEGAERLGDRAAFLVALFGPNVTKRVGAATARAIAEGRWDALHLASAASDVLGPEQIEQVLALEGSGFIEGASPSVLAGYLDQVLGTLPGPRRLALLVDLWGEVAAHRERLARRQRLLATQAKERRVDDLRRRRLAYEDEILLDRLKLELGVKEPTVLAAARWTPGASFWHAFLHRILDDALAVTALLRTAVAVGDHGVEEGLARSAKVLAAAGGRISEDNVGHARRKVEGLTGLPARPGCHVHDLLKQLGKGDRLNVSIVKQRLARAFDYALLLIEVIERLTDHSGIPEPLVQKWSALGMKAWREEVGYSSVRPPDGWDVDLWWSDRTVLAQRLEAGVPAEDEEQIGDLLWFAEMIDALAQLHGHDAAHHVGRYGSAAHYDPPAEEPEPLTPGSESVSIALSGTAQLVALGGVPPRGTSAWGSFVAGLRAATSVAEALQGEFAVPAPLAVLDGTLIPGTDLRFRLAHSPRTLAEWASYMGNCIAGYAEDATSGRSVLAALCDRHERVVVNIELVAARPAVKGWRVNEIKARFNGDPDEEVEARFRAWLATVPGETKELPPQPEAWDAPPARRVARPSAAQLPHELVRLVAESWHDPATVAAVETLAALSGTRPDTVLPRLRRLDPGQLKDLCRLALRETDLVTLWTATAARPLAALGPEFAVLTRDVPLPRSLRRLVRQPALAPAYSLGIAGLRLRAALGDLVDEDDPLVARAIGGRTTESVLCALVVKATCDRPRTRLAELAPPHVVTVPGYPVTALDEATGPWQQALPAAQELGADTSVFWQRIADNGLCAPSSWLGAGGWPALWARAH